MSAQEDSAASLGGSVEDGGDLNRKLRAWAETSGRALELRVTRAFRAAGALVQPSYTYADPVTAKPRETDVRADFEWYQQLTPTEGFPCTLSIVAECKSSKKDPWVGFYEGSPHPRLRPEEDWVAWCGTPWTALAEVPRPWVSRPPFQGMLPASHVVSARLGKDPQPGHNPANDAVRQVMSATVAHFEQWRSGAQQPTVALFLIPMIVTAAQLFACTLEEDGSTSFAPVDRLDVWAADSAGTRRRALIVGEEAVDQLALELKALVEGTQEDAQRRAYPSV